jgi:hypothetical protein
VSVTVFPGWVEVWVVEIVELLPGSEGNIVVVVLQNISEVIRGLRQC